MEKVIDITERVPTMKKRRKRRSNLKFIMLITIFLAIISVLLYFQLPYSNIKKINVSGANLRDETFYLEQSTLQVEDSLWGFKTADIEAKMTGNEWVKSATVKRKFLNDVEIHIVEWKKVAYILKDNEFFPMLENGVIFNDTGEIVPIDAPIFLKFDDEALRKKLLKQLAQLEPAVLSQISQINANTTESDPYAITLFMNDGYEVRADINTLAEKLNYYPSIIAQIENTGDYEKGIIDIEVGSYYSPYSEEYSLVKQNADSEEGGEGEQANEQQQEQQTGE